MGSPLPRTLNESPCGFAFQPLAMENPGAIWQGMFGDDLPALDPQTECPRTYPQEGGRFSQIHPTLYFAVLGTVAWNAVVTTQRDHAFAGPTIPSPGLQTIAIQHPGNQIVGADVR